MPVLDFPSIHGRIVVLEALEVDDEHVRQHLDAVTLYRIHLQEVWSVWF